MTMDHNNKREETIKTMIEELISCPIDNEPYDLNNRKPIILKNCGHAICKNCYDMLSICPFCRVAYNSFLNNYDQISKMDTIEGLKRILFENKRIV